MTDSICSVVGPKCAAPQLPSASEAQRRARRGMVETFDIPATTLPAAQSVPAGRSTPILTTVQPSSLRLSLHSAFLALSFAVLAQRYSQLLCDRYVTELSTVWSVLFVFAVLSLC